MPERDAVSPGALPPTALGDVPADRQALAPVPFASRIGAMDIARGVALLGIFVMNIGAFSDPAGEYSVPVNPETATRAEIIWHFLTHGLFESKFYTLFSLLFGMGFIILTDRVQARRSSPTAVALRRFGFLAVLGLMHAHLLWFGDILFVYACCSVLLLAVRKCRAKTLIVLGASLTVVGDLIILGMTFLGVVFGTGQTPVPVETPAPLVSIDPGPRASEGATAEEAASLGDGVDVDSTLAEARQRAAESRDRALAGDASLPGNEVSTGESVAGPAPVAEVPLSSTVPENAEPLRGWAFIRDAFENARGSSPMQSAEWAEAETAAYREGPWADLAAFRSLTWGFVLLIVAFGAAPRIIGLFILGAGLIRAEFFLPRHRRVHVTLVAIGLVIGVPVALYAAWNQIHAFPHDGSKLPMVYVPLQAMHALGAILIPLALLSGAALAANRAACSPGSALARGLHPLACTGRMALTNYLTQTLVGTTLCYFYGFALFGTLDPVEKVAIVLGTFACQMVLSTLWFRVFAIGPVEYVWRAFTYLRAPRLRANRAI